MQIPCPTCRTPLAVPDSALGKAVRCPKCTIVFTAEAPIEAVEVAPVLPAVTPPSVVPIALPVEPSPPVSPLTDEPGFLQPSPTPMDEAPWTQSPTNPLDFADRDTPIIRMTNQTRAQAKRAGSWLVMGAGLHIFLMICFAGLGILNGSLMGARPTYVLGQACGLFVGISIGTLVMIGGTSVANLRNKVMGYIGSVLGLLLGALTGFGAMGFCFLSLRATALPRFHDAGIVILGVLFLLLTGISVCYLVGGILTLIVLSSPAAQGEFERPHIYRR